MSSLDWKDIEIVLRRKPPKGTLGVSEGLSQSQHGVALTRAPLGILPAERLAKMLLREFASREQEK